MGFIHELPDWPEITWDAKSLSSLLGEVRHRQGRLLGRMEGLGFTLRSEASLGMLTADVVKSSAIEGEILSAEQVRSSIARRLNIDIGPVSPASRNVEGIVEMMLDATQNYLQPLNAERLFGWHAALFPTGRSSMRKIVVGNWRRPESGEMQVVSGPIGREQIHFEAPQADRLEREMEAFLAWINLPRDTDPVLVAGLAHFWFVTIHPFEDGNGRIGRAVADLALARADGTPQRFYSMSAQIELERKEYYLALEASQRGDLNITSWMEWFLGCLSRAILKAEESLGEILRKSRIWESINQTAARGSVNERQRTVINRLVDGFEGKLTSSKYAKLAKCSEDTALRDIRALVERGVLRQNEGGGRSTSYSIVEPTGAG